MTALDNGIAALRSAATSVRSAATRAYDLYDGFSNLLRNVMPKGLYARALLIIIVPMVLLAASPGETVPRLALAGNGGNGGNGAVGERAVDVQINRLRRKIERDPANPLLVQTVRGVGYRLVAAP